MFKTRQILKCKSIYIICVLSLIMLFASAVPAQASSGKVAYHVRSGDTLVSLAKRYYTDSDLIAAMNNMDNAVSLPVGKIIYLPQDPEINISVAKGQTLWSIAKKYNTSIETLAAYNELINPNELKIGQSIAIPGINIYEEPNAIAVTAIASRSGIFQRMNTFKTDDTISNLPKTNCSIKWRCPLEGPITSDFGMRSSGFHHGVDVGADEGTKVYSVAAGRVTFAGWKNSIYGNMIIIDHGNGWSTVYSHASKVLIKAGQKVKAGKAIMRVGQTGNATGPHLHIEVHQGDTILNPHKYILFKSK